MGYQRTVGGELRVVTASLAEWQGRAEAKQILWDPGNLPGTDDVSVSASRVITPGRCIESVSRSTSHSKASKLLGTPCLSRSGHVGGRCRVLNYFGCVSFFIAYTDSRCRIVRRRLIHITFYSDRTLMSSGLVHTREVNIGTRSVVRAAISERAAILIILLRVGYQTCAGVQPVAYENE